MFSIEQIANVVQSPAFLEDERTVQEALSRYRLGQDQLFLKTASERLGQFVECVLSSAPEWNRGDASNRLCRLAAEVAEVLASHNGDARRMKLKSALLYELAGLPAISQSVAASNNLPPSIKPFLLRSGAFGTLSSELSDRKGEESAPSGENLSQLADLAMTSNAYFLARYLHGDQALFSPYASALVSDIATDFDIGYTATELRALRTVMRQRADSATRTRVDKELFSSLRRSVFPVELWPAQLAALDGGLLDENIESWGLASPTGTGKSFLFDLR